MNELQKCKGIVFRGHVNRYVNNSGKYFSNADIADVLNISLVTVSRIKNNHSWRQVS